MASRSKEHQDSGMAFLRDAYEAWLACSALPRKSKYVKAVLWRSAFENMAVLNMARLARGAGWAMSSAVRETAEAMYMGFGQSKVIEDGNHFMRSMEARTQANEVATNVRCWHTLVKKKVLSEARGNAKRDYLQACEAGC